MMCAASSIKPPPSHCGRGRPSELPLNQSARMVMAVFDEAGDILAAYRMPDATFFSLDVAVSEARNAFYFSSRRKCEKC